MKKIRKITLGVFITSTLVLGLYACTNDEITTEDLTTNQTNLVAKAGEFIITTGEFYMVNKGTLVNDLKEDYKLEYRFVSEEPIPTDSVEDFTSYYEAINGRLELVIDSSGSNSYPCTYEGLRQCTVDKIDDMNLIEKLICSFAGPTCVAQNFGHCAWENCGREAWYEEQQGDHIAPHPQQ